MSGVDAVARQCSGLDEDFRVAGELLRAVEGAEVKHALAEGQACGDVLWVKLHAANRIKVFAGGWSVGVLYLKQRDQLGHVLEMLRPRWS